MSERSAVKFQDNSLECTTFYKYGFTYSIYIRFGVSSMIPYMHMIYSGSVRPMAKDHQNHPCHWDAENALTEHSQSNTSTGLGGFFLCALCFPFPREDFLPRHLGNHLRGVLFVPFFGADDHSSPGGPDTGVVLRKLRQVQRSEVHCLAGAVPGAEKDDDLDDARATRCWRCTAEYKCTWVTCNQDVAS